LKDTTLFLRVQVTQADEERLAVTEKVSASTQNQAFCAILLLFCEGTDFRGFGAFCAAFLMTAAVYYP